jgi:hypothetical protein
MITADLYPLIDKTFEFETKGHKKQTHVLVGEEDPYGHIKLLVEVTEPNGGVHRDWIDYEFFLTYIDRAVA